MEPYKLILVPDEGLLKKTEPILQGKIKSGRYDEVVDRMLLTMSEHSGAGLAAPQIGLNMSLFVVAGESPVVAFNPKISLREGVPLDEDVEGCLSIPGVYAPVRRPTELVLDALGRDGEPFTLNATGMTARVIAHEHDHVHGILFLHRLSEGNSLRLYRRISSLTSELRPS